MCPVGAASVSADRQTEGQTDVTKLIVACRVYANVQSQCILFIFVQNFVFKRGIKKHFDRDKC